MYGCLHYLISIYLKKKSLRFGKYLVIDVCHEKAKKRPFLGFFM